MTCPRASVHHGYFLISKLFMLHGAKPSEFETRRPGGAQNYYPSPEIMRFYEGILKARKSIICLIGIHKKCLLLKSIGKDGVTEIARAIYQTRGDPAWSQTVP